MSNVVQVELYKNEHIVSSRVIAEQLGKQHKHILEKIRTVLTLPEYRLRNYSYGNNNSATEYLLNKDSFILLVMNYEGFNDFKRAYIKRFNELNNDVKIALPQSFSEALQLAADQAKQLEIQAPKVEYYDKILDSVSTFTTTQIAGDLNMSAIKLNKILASIGLQYRQSNQYHLYSKYRPLKYAETRTKPYIKNSGQTATSHYLVWTEKGREYILNAVTEFFCE